MLGSKILHWKDARLIQIEDGPLVNAFDLPEGKRAFRFRWGGGTYVVPKTTTTTGQVQLVGSTAFYSEQKLEAGGAVVNDPGCLITYIAKWDATKQGWIVSEIAYPHRAFC